MSEPAAAADPPAPIHPHSAYEVDDQVAELGEDGAPEERPAAMDRRVDFAVATGFLLFGVWLWVSAGRIREGSVPDPIGSGGVGRILGAVIVVLSASLIVRRLMRRNVEGRWVPAEGPGDDPRGPASSRRAFAVFVALVGYAAAMDYAGYLVATPLFVLAALWLLDARTPVKLVVLPLAYTVTTWVLFVGVFGVLLPLGILQRWDYYLWFHL